MVQPEVNYHRCLLDASGRPVYGSQNILLFKSIETMEWQGINMDIISQVRQKAPDFPKIHKEQHGLCIYWATWVPFIYRDIEFKRILLESVVLTGRYTMEEFEKRWDVQIKLIQEKSVPMWLDRVVGPVKNDTQIIENKTK